MSRMSERERVIRQRLKTDFPHYAAKCLKIRTKAGQIVPFVLNDVQRIVHDKLEQQLRDTGRVRCLILKARQPGISTLIEGRFYHKATHSRGLRAFILTHRDQATENLFGMAKRFHDNCPPLVKPQTKAINAKELAFGFLDSAYQVGTAKASGVGRSDTIQLLHGSEVAFWANADEHAAGILQAVPDEDGTEVILESTANGIGGLFHAMWQAAVRGKNAYLPIFVPWTQHGPYQATPPVDWEPPDAFAEYGETHGLTPEQVYWAWETNAELAMAAGSSPDEPSWQFYQEYPATAVEAFQAGGSESFISSQRVMAARRNTVPDQTHAPLVLGVDIARGGGDKTRIIDRLGRCAGYRVNRTIDSDDLMEVTGMVKREIDRLHPDMTFIDVTGLGAGVVDRLRELGYRKVLRGINFGAKASNFEKYANKRAEMWGRMGEWFADEGGCDIPDDDELHADICAPTSSFDSNSRVLLESKKDIKKRLGESFGSPDGGDALALTFAESVRKDTGAKHQPATAAMAADPRRRGGQARTATAEMRR